MVREMVRRLFGDRRHQSVPIPTDRRAKMSVKDADEMLHDAIKGLEQTVRIKRDELLKK